MSSFATVSSVTKFNPKALEAGDNNQLAIWTEGSGSSIYIQWVPDEMNEKDASRIFSQYGDVDRIEFVPKCDKNRKQIGRMLFVHFNEWTSTSDFHHTIATQHPEPLLLEYRVSNRYGNDKVYSLKCRVNMRPISKVEYSNSQLTDMFERLNDRVTEAMDLMKKEIAQLRLENETLRSDLKILGKMELPIVFNQLTNSPHDLAVNLV